MQDKIIEKIRKYNNIAILGFGREGKSTYNFIRKYDKDIKLTILDERQIEVDDGNAHIKCIKMNLIYKNLILSSNHLESLVLIIVMKLKIS